MSERPTLYIAKVGETRIAALEGSKRVRLSVCGREIEMTAGNARDVMLKIAEAIRRSS